jgi:uncharacterized protein YidB (DUF937 family)
VGILDNLFSTAEHSAGIEPSQHQDLLQLAMEKFGNHEGITNLQNQAQNQGLGGLVNSWIGTGSNQPIAPDQVQSVLGSDTLNQIAARIGIPPAIASVALSKILPALVDRLTPNGQLPPKAA